MTHQTGFRWAAWSAFGLAAAAALLWFLRRPIEDRIPAAQAIDQALATCSLTHGGRPFHAEMQIGDDQKDPSHNATIVLDWYGARSYNLAVQAEAFTGHITIDGDRLAEQHTGNSAPAWLQRFVTALLDPLPMSQDADLRRGTIPISGHNLLGHSWITRGCTHRGVASEGTEALVCFQHGGRYLEHAQDPNYNMGFSEYAPFGQQQVARRYRTMFASPDSPNRQILLTGHLTTVRELAPNEAHRQIPIAPR